MNELLDRLFELPPRQRVLLLAGGIVLLLFFYWYFLYGPRLEQISELEQQRDQVRADRDRKTRMLANMEETRKEVAQLDGDLKMAVAQLPDTKEIPDLLSTVSSLGRESGLEIIQFKQRPEQYEDFYAIVPVDIVVRGTYKQLASFVDNVGQMARIVTVADVHMKSPPKVEGETVFLDTSAVTITYRFLDEAERQRIAKQKEKEKGARQ
jgi:type IV pilus assembly protein PilO